MQGTSLQERLDIVSKKVENQRCCDCFDTQPRFASIIATLVGDRIGAVLCFQCSRVHDDLGTDLCYVLNISNVEEWASEEVGAMERGGNKVINAIFESKLAFDHPRPDSSSDMNAREEFCFEKYVNRKFYSSTAASKHLGKSKPNSLRLFSLKAPKGKSSGKSSRKITSFMSKSFTNGDAFSSGDDDDGLGYGDATPDSHTNQLGYGDAAPDSEPQRPDAEAQRPRQRRSRRRASISVPSEEQPKMGRDNARPGSEQPAPAPQGRRSGRRASISAPSKPQPQMDKARQESEQPTPAPQGRRSGRRASISAPSNAPRRMGSSETGQKANGKQTPTEKSSSLSQSLDKPQSSDNQDLDQRSVQTSSARRSTRRRGSVSGGNVSMRRVAKSASTESFDDSFVW